MILVLRLVERPSAVLLSAKALYSPRPAAIRRLGLILCVVCNALTTEVARFTLKYIYLFCSIELMSH